MISGKRDQPIMRVNQIKSERARPCTVLGPEPMRQLLQVRVGLLRVRVQISHLGDWRIDTINDGTVVNPGYGLSPTPPRRNQCHIDSMS